LDDTKDKGLLIFQNLNIHYIPHKKNEHVIPQK